MSRLVCMITALMLALAAAAGGAAAQGFSGLARIDAAGSALRDTRGGVEIALALSQGVPFRLYTLAGPDRLIVDFREVDWSGFDSAALAAQASGASAVRAGGWRPGWSRMVVDLARPMVVRLAEMRVDPATGAARLTITLGEVDRETFEAASAGAADPGRRMAADLPAAPRDDGRLTVVIDPGHGGIDPGAERGDLREKELMLLFAFDLRDALLRVDGVDVVLTRTDDVFVSLEGRIAIAHKAGADVFLSLHADSLAEGQAHGAVVYSLSEEASDEASALLAERHDRADILAGVDLTGRDDVIADVLLDLARLETTPRADALADALVEGLRDAGVPLNRRPRRAAAFSVLKSADFPSLLLEIGFLSSTRDLDHLSDPIWRRRAAAGLRDGLQAWMIADEATRSLVRK